jgi:hypothetical protein
MASNFCTASNAIGEIVLGLPLRAFDAMSASSKNLRRAWTLSRALDKVHYLESDFIVSSLIWGLMCQGHHLEMTQDKNQEIKAIGGAPIDLARVSAPWLNEPRSWYVLRRFVGIALPLRNNLAA